MSKVTVWFIKSAMVYLLLAVLLGIHMSMAGPGYPWMQIHAHFNLLGWMSMMIFGVGYHILPRFSGQPLWSVRLSELHLWLANAGLLGMAAGWFVLSAGGGKMLLFFFSTVEAVSVALFVVNMFKTIRAMPAPPMPPKP
ncbi:MAG TPA: hypothetical protein ENJ37_01550 [Deltaproteobacteria bacterium]|nr:hypothetical protein [Deltaproteobacteria bacterium]